MKTIRENKTLSVLLTNQVLRDVRRFDSIPFFYCDILAFEAVCGGYNMVRVIEVTLN